MRHMCSACERESTGRDCARARMRGCGVCARMRGCVRGCACVCTRKQAFLRPCVGVRVCACERVRV
jgi:hypothetical protein